MICNGYRITFFFKKDNLLFFIEGNGYKLTTKASLFVSLTRLKAATLWAFYIFATLTMTPTDLPLLFQHPFTITLFVDVARSGVIFLLTWHPKE